MPARETTAGTPTEWPVVVGTEIGGFQVKRIAREHPSRWIATDAVASGGHSVRLWISTRTALADPGLSDVVAQITRLRTLQQTVELPLLVPAGAGHEDGRWFIALPRPSGPTLADRLLAGPLGSDEAVRLLSEVAGALDTLRAFGLPHAPLTPERIRLSTGSPTRALLYDFGIPLRAHPGHESTRVAADYLAPEVTGGGALEAPGDVYALACILVECLTGTAPRPRGRSRVADARRAGSRSPSSSSRRELPPKLQRVLRAALDERSEKRPQSAAELMRATQRALGARRVPIPVGVPPASAPAWASGRESEGLRHMLGPRLGGGLRRLPPAAPRAAGVRGPAPVPAAADRRLPPPVPAAVGRRSPPPPVPGLVPAGRRPGAASPAASRRRRGPAALVAAAALLVVAGSVGYAVGHARPVDAPRQAVVVRGTPSPVAPGAARAVALRGVATAMDRLRTERRAGRGDLRAARTPASQAAAATALADAYRAAGAASADAMGRTPLAAALGSTGRAYRGLASAARATDTRAFLTARGRVAAQERALEVQLAAASPTD